MPHHFDDYRELIESSLDELLPRGHLRAASRLNEAVRYAIFPGGKRMRPMLALLGAKVSGCEPKRALAAACATEFLHASSLIFDDLPAMDDADVRRGRPALHLVYGEDVALLSALALLNQAYGIFGSNANLMREVSASIGVNGMIGGQAADLEMRTCGGDLANFSSRNRKTTALMRLTLTAGAIAGGASQKDVAALARCGECLGEAYQIYDDVLDEFGCGEETGKTPRQDARHQRASHLAEFGIAASHDRMTILISESKDALRERFGESGSVVLLLKIIDSVVRQADAASLVPA